MKYTILLLLAVLLCCLSLSACKKQKAKRVLPKKLKLVIPLENGKTINMALKESEKEVDEGEVVGDDRKGDIVAKPPTPGEHMATYRNKKYQALFTVTANENDEKKVYTYMGGYRHKGKEYNLMPADYDAKMIGERIESSRTIKIGDVDYKLSLLKPPKMVPIGDDELVAPKDGNETISEVFNRVQNESGVVVDNGISNQYGGRQNLIMETLILIDVSTYQKFFKFCKYDHQNTVNHLKFYYTHIMNGVSDTYERIRHNQYSWKAIVTALYIARNQAEAPFTGPAVRQGDQLATIPALQAINRFVVEQVKSKRVNWPSFDYTVMFHDLRTPGILGVAYVESVCLHMPVGLVVNTDTFQTIQTTSHEIGHIMGSHHDQIRACLNEHKFVMAPSANGDSGKYDNERTFSTCSVKYFADHIDNLNRMQKNCLLNKPSHLLQPMDSNKNSNKLLGQNYDLDAQCALIYGHGSTFCGTEAYGDAVCKNILCTIVSTQACSYTRFLRANDGTPCGNRKWCINGRCVADAKAPSIVEKKCPYGDSKEKLYSHISGLTCALVARSYQGECADQTVRKKCCQTCEDIAKKNDPNCPWGDLVKTCRRDTCYNDYWMENCCKTCKKNANGCPPVDRSGCERLTESCTSNYMKTYCCNKCKNGGSSSGGSGGSSGGSYGGRGTGTSGGRYPKSEACTNKATWCESYIEGNKENCFHDVKKNCCATCKRLGV